MTSLLLGGTYRRLDANGHLKQLQTHSPRPLRQRQPKKTVYVCVEPVTRTGLLKSTGQSLSKPTDQRQSKLGKYK